MISNNEVIAEINSLAKTHYGDVSLAWTWGCAQALLTTQQLNLILDILKEKETN
jgi:hypothetical protein